MKFVKDNRGIAHLAIFIVFAVAVLGFVGYTAWNAWQTNKKQDSTQVYESKKSDETKINDPYAGWKVYANSKYKFSFKYPKNWALKDEYSPLSTSGERVLLQMHVDSPDYKKSTSEFGDTASGSSAEVQIDSIKNSGTAYTSVKSILDGTYSSKFSLTNRKPLTVDNLSGAEYIVVQSEGPKVLSSQFDKGDLTLDFSLPQDDNGQFNYADIYRLIVKSFTLD